MDQNRPPRPRDLFALTRIASVPMPNILITDQLIEDLPPGPTAYDVRDSETRGFGIRVSPSGTKTFFVHFQHKRRRIWKTMGKHPRISAADARDQARAFIRAARRNEAAPLGTAAPLFETVSDHVVSQYREIWAPGTTRLNLAYLKKHILPYFGSMPVAQIGPADVRAWFERMQPHQSAAHRSLPIISLILTEAERTGYRPKSSNPCRGFQRPNASRPIRFLTADELRRLCAELARLDPLHPLPTAIIRLLLLTGCRKSQILSLEWTDLRSNHILLPTKAANPRKIWLSRPSLAILATIPHRRRFVFPAPRSRGPYSAAMLDHYWSTLRTNAALPDARISDLRGTYAALAVLHGASPTELADLLGYRTVSQASKHLDAATSFQHRLEDLIPQPTATHEASHARC